MYTVYDRIFGDFPAKLPYIHRIYMVLANPSHVPKLGCILGFGIRIGFYSTQYQTGSFYFITWGVVFTACVVFLSLLLFGTLCRKKGEKD